MSYYELIFKSSAFTIEQIPLISEKDGKNEIVFAGRSNVGKSSLINALFSTKIAKISSMPGKTRSINFYSAKENTKSAGKARNDAEKFLLVDLPGFGYAARGKEEIKRWGLMTNEYFKKHRQAIKAVLQLVDFRHGFLKNDILLSEYIQNFDIPAAVIFTKIDKIAISGRQLLLKKYILSGFSASLGAHLVSSSSSKEGIENLKQELLTWMVMS